MHNESNNARPTGAGRRGTEDAPPPRPWFSGPDFRRGLALQVASGLIIAAIIAAIGFGIHQVRGGDAPSPVATQQQAKASDPEPTASSSTTQDRMVERLTENVGDAIWVLLPVAMISITLLFGFTLLIGGGSTSASRTSTKPSLTKK